MKTQFDYQVRVVSLENLQAMCRHISGTCHRYSVHKVSKSHVTVVYSNPDEYGSEKPVHAMFPCFDHHDNNPSVVLEITRTVHGDDETWQDFQELLDCPQLWRNGDSWRTEYEILTERHPSFTVTSSWDKDGCIQTWHCNGEDFMDYRLAQARAVEHCKANEGADMAA